MSLLLALALATSGLLVDGPNGLDGPQRDQNAQVGKEADAEKSTGKVGERIPAFTGKVKRGDKSADFDSAKHGKTTVYLLVGVTCPATEPYVERLCLLESIYMPKGVDFVFLYVNGDKVAGESPADKAKFHKKCRFAGAFLNDGESAIAAKLGAQKTGEALVVDKDGKVLYRGGIDDNLLEPAKVKTKYVVQALDEVLAGKAVTKTDGQVFG